MLERLGIGRPSGLSSVHGAVAGQACAQPARLLQPLTILAQVFVLGLHIPPPVRTAIESKEWQEVMSGGRSWHLHRMGQVACPPPQRSWLLHHV